ncbi:MAG TPA: PDZ domain-containing protein [Candidatus Dormibacteraeota bacterium]|nr:PDZ domain-containing protein [Candidatus Dormibacteraeota bacterium]
MNKTKTFLFPTALVLAGIVLIALPSPSRVKQDDKRPVIVEEGNVLFSSDDEPALQEQFVIPFNEEGASWLGVETHDVTAEKAKEFKLSAERGVLLGKIVPDSPAAKGGLKQNDVVMELNGQRVESAAQFRRMVREIPAGRTVQLAVWREGRTQTLSVKLGKSEEGHSKWMKSMPGSFAFKMPEIPLIPEMPEGPGMENFKFFSGAHARLGIDAEDLSGQLASFFGIPDGEGILVRSVNSGSPAEKAGLKAGDVITALNGERVRSVGELREKIFAHNDAKNMQLSVLRNKAETKLNVELPPAPEKQMHVMKHHTNV